MSSFEASVRANTTQFVKDIKTVASKTTVTVKVKPEGGTDTITSSMTKTMDASGKLTTSLKKVDGAGKLLSTTVTTSSKAVKGMGRDFLDTFGKVAKFGAVTAILGAFTKGVTEATKAVKEFDKAQTDFRKVSELSGEALDDYSDKLGKLGESVYRSKTEMLEAATLFKQGGFDEEQSAQLARTANLFMNIADTEVSAADSSAMIISQLKAFNLTAEQSAMVVDVINENSNRFAVTSSDLATGLTAAGAALSTYGNDFGSTTALITAGTEVFQGKAGQVARGLNTIAGRITQNEELLKKYGVSVKDTNGELISTYNVLKQLYPVYDKLSSSEQASIATALGGVNQRKIFTAVLTNFQTAIDSTEVSMHSLGSAEEENAKRADSIEAKTKAMNAAFVNLVTGEGGLQSFIKGLLSAGTAILKFASSDVGSTILKLGSLSVGILLVTKGMKALILHMTTAALVQGGMATATAASTAANLGFAASIKAITGAMLTNPLFIGMAVVSGIVLFASVLDKANVSLDEMNNKISELTEETEKLKAKETELTDLSKKTKLTESEQNRLDILQAQIAANEKLIQQEYDKASVKRESEEEDYKSNPSGGQFALTKEQFEYRKPNADLSTSERNDYNIKQIDALGVEKSSVSELIDVYKFLSTTKSKDAEIDNMRLGSINEVTKALLAQLEPLNKRLEEGKELSTYDQSLYNGIMDIVYSFNKSTDAVQTNTDSLDENEEAANQQRSELEALQSTLESLSGVNLTTLTDAFDTMRQAQSEMNSANGLSIESFEKLMSLGDASIATLFNQAGALDTTQESQLALYKGTIDRMAIEAASNQVTYATNFMIGKQAGAYDELTSSVKNNTNANWDNVASLVSVSGLEGRDLEALNDKINAIKGWAESAKKSVTITNMNTHATKSSTKANKENSDSLNDLKKSYEKVIGYINDKVDDQIDKLNDLKDASLNSIDAQIDKLNEQKDADEEYWDAKIDALNSQNDAIEQQIELEQLQANLATARNKKVLIYREGRGFGYESDMGAVNDAQKELDEFNRKKKFEDSIKQLENFRDLASKNYDKQIADLEAYRKSVEANYDAQIKYYEDWKNGFKSSVDSYENEQNRLLALQLTGIDFEKANWQARINNLASFVSNWNSLQSQMTNSTPTSSGGGGGSVSAPTVSGGSVTGGVSKPNAKTLSLQKFMNNQFGISSNLLGIWDTAMTESVKQMQKRIGLPSPNGLYNRPTYIALTKYLGRTSGDTSKIPAYASGIASVPDNQMAMVGDNPNTSELVIGSKLNGSMTKLSKGSQVVDAKTTRNIMGLSNSINGGGALYNTYDSNQPISIANLNLSLDGITDGKGFSEYINNHLRNEIYQKSKSRG